MIHIGVEGPVSIAVGAVDGHADGAVAEQAALGGGDKNRFKDY
jgi:hypothetical protein